MTDPAIDAWRARLDELAADAVRAMTAAARTPSPVGDRPLDFADFAARVLSAVAANLGGTVQLLAGRPGSWEADLVARLVNGTVGWSGEYLAEHRIEGTDPAATT